MKLVDCFRISVDLIVSYVITFCVVPVPGYLPNIDKDKGNVFKPKPLQPGPWITMTKGEIWPTPNHQQRNSSFLVLDVNKFKINVSKINICFKLDSIYNNECI